MPVLDYELLGYSEGAQVLSIPSTNRPIRVFNPICFSHVPCGSSFQQLNMTVLSAQSDIPQPAIIFYPGGGFAHTIRDKFLELRMALAQAGFVVAAAEYRVLPERYPAPILDGKSAIRFLREHATMFSLDPQRIGVIGDSAGGYMAQMMAMANEAEFEQGPWLNQSSTIQAAVSLYGISNLMNIGEGLGHEREAVHQSPAVNEALLVHGTAFDINPGATIDSDPQLALHYSPMGHLKGPLPPMLLMHGSADTLVSPIQSQQLYQALRAKGYDADYRLLQDANHGDSPWYHPQVNQLIVKWFQQHL